VRAQIAPTSLTIAPAHVRIAPTGVNRIAPTIAITIAPASAEIAPTSAEPERLSNNSRIEFVTP